MWGFLSEVKFSALPQIIIFFGLFLFLISRRRDPEVVASRPRVVRLAILALLFLYFLWSQSSLLLPSLRNVNLMGMVLINLIMVWNIINMVLERPYRRALKDFAAKPHDQEAGDLAWQAGQRFYYSFFLAAALLSGTLPWRFLAENARDSIRTDLVAILAEHGKQESFASFRALLIFLRNRLQSNLLPEEFREAMTRLLAQLGQHPWLEEQVNDYLRLILESPEHLPHV
jgi:hypothetical protein